MSSRAARNAPRPVAPARFLGWQPRPSGRPAVELWNLIAAIPGHPAGSTVTRETIEKAGYHVPDPPEPAPNPCHNPPTPSQIRKAADYIRGLKGHAARAFAAAYGSHLVYAAPPAPDHHAHHLDGVEANTIRRELARIFEAAFPNPDSGPPGETGWIEPARPEERAEGPYRLCFTTGERFALSTLDAIRAQKSGVPFQPHKPGHYWTKKPNPRGATTRRKRHAANPPRKRVLIYTGGQLRGTWYGRHRNGKLYKHPFGGGSKAIYGLPDGSIQIVPAKGRLWGMH